MSPPVTGGVSRFAWTSVKPEHALHGHRSGVHLGAEGQIRQDADLPAGIMAFHIGGGIRLGIALFLSLLQSVGKARAGADHIPIGTLAHDGRNRIDHNGFAGTGLSRNNDKTLRKRNFQRVYQYVIPDVELLKHYALLLFLVCHPVFYLSMLELIDSHQAWLWLTLVVLGDFDLLAVLIYLLKRVALILEYLDAVEPFENNRHEIIKGKLLKNLQELTSGEYDENRFEQELIFYLEKLDITEEKVRLRKHCDYFYETIDEENAGKKLGFIAQEMGREINTLGSKANDADIQRLVVKMKDELEKIKEQLFNIL